MLSQPLRWKRTFHWLHMCRAFRIALDIRKLLLLIVGIGLIDLGNHTTAILFPVEPSKNSVVNSTILTRYDSDFVHWNSGELATDKTVAEVVGDFPVHPGDTLLQAVSNWPVVLRPFREFVAPAARLLGHDQTWMGVLDALFRLLWSIIIWSLVAGAVTRMAAVEFANDERSKVLSAVWFAVTRFPAYAIALLVPTLVVLLLWLAGFVGGLMGRIGGIGDVTVAILYPIGMVLSLIMTLIVMGMAIGWPLMIAAVSTDDTDGFDAFSRAFSHIYNRPWNYLWNVIIALTYGSAVILFVGMFGTLVVHFTDLSVGSGTGQDRMTQMQAEAPIFRVTQPRSVAAKTDVGKIDAAKSVAVDAPVDAGSDSELETVEVSAISVMFTSLWLRLWCGLMVAFVFSYFWSASTINFFLLRQSDDGAPLTTIAQDDPDDDEPLPAASEELPSRG
ncbi:MAG: hypothetical protein O3A00_16165 [Planctomycetota bacterium]|nr:hypothetical protein [Planctomycetota bacterium]